MSKVQWRRNGWFDMESDANWFWCYDSKMRVKMNVLLTPDGWISTIVPRVNCRSKLISITYGPYKKSVTAKSMCVKVARQLGYEPV